VLGSFAVAVLSLAVFVVIELRRAHPMLDLRLFKEREFGLANTVILLSAAGMFGGLFLLPVFFQRIQGHGPAEAGLLLMPQALASGVCMPFAGRLYDRFGPRYIIASGMTLVAVTSAMLMWLEADTSGWAITPVLIVRGIGMGFSMMPAMTAALNSVHGTAIPRATALSNTVRQVAASLGVAVLATILQQRGETLTADATAGLAPGTPEFAAAAVDAAVRAFHEAFLISALAIIPAILAALLMRTGRATHPVPGAESAEAQAARLESQAL
jgi:DHA2 family multidrug resistance protein